MIHRENMTLNEINEQLESIRFETEQAYDQY